MSLANIKLNNSASRGFTIVELLIVVVVIAILAAITIVSYNGITTRANASAAKSTASTIQKKVELYQAEQGRYPVSLSELNDSTKSYYLTNGSLTVAGAAPTSTNGKTRVLVASCGNATPTTSNVTGVQISYYNYEASSPNPVLVSVGNCGTVGNTAHSTANWQGAAE